MVYVLVSVILTLHPMRLDTQPSQLNCDCPSIPFTFRDFVAARVKESSMGQD